jgi:hypothetical protein
MTWRNCSLVLASVSMIAAGCASAPASGGAVTGATGESTRRADVITSAELMSGAGDAPDLYAAISRLRPQFLQARSATNTRGMQEPIRVYVGGSPATTVDYLRSVRPSQVKEVRWMSGRDATTRYGTGHGAGVITVTLM